MPTVTRTPIVPLPPTPPPSGDLLTSADLTYLGLFGMPVDGYTATDPYSSWQPITGRNVAGVVRLFTTGNVTKGGFIYEFTPPGTLATSKSQITFGQGPYRATVAHDWGNIYGEDPTTGNVKRENGPGSLCDIDAGLLYTNGKLFWQFYASYNVTANNNRCIGMSTLDDGSGVATRYGPWRVATLSGHVGAKFAGGYMASIPSAFAATYFGGRTLHLGMAASSGVASAPIGIVCWPCTEPDTSLAESSISVATDIAITPLSVIAFDAADKQPITIEGVSRRLCGWDDPGAHSTTTATANPGDTTVTMADTTLYDGPDSAIAQPPPYKLAWIGSTGGNYFYYSGKSPSSGAGTLTGVPTSGPGSIPVTITSGTAILLGNYDNRRGGVTANPANLFGPDTGEGLTSWTANYFDYIGGALWIQSSSGKKGILYLGVMPDVVAGTDYGSDDRPHVRYAGQATCPHGQVSPTFQSTGPCSTNIVNFGWFFDPQQFAEVAQGSRPQSAIVPTSFWRWGTLTGSQVPLEPLFPGNNLTSAWFDAVTDRLYLMERYGESSQGSAMGVCHVFHVA